jgi:hypothetical protein
MAQSFGLSLAPLALKNEGKIIIQNAAQVLALLQQLHIQKMSEKILLVPPPFGVWLSQGFITSLFTALERTD